MKVFSGTVILCIFFCVQNAIAATDSSWSSKILESISSIFARKYAANEKTKTPIVLDDASVKIVNDRIQEGKNLINVGKTVDASNMFLKALELNPDSIEANSLIGSCYLLLNKPDLAEGFLYAAVVLSEWKDAVSIANLAESLRLNKDPNLAVQVAMKGFENLGQKDDSGLIQYVLGASYRDQKKFSLSSDWFLASALRQPKNIDAWILASTMLFPDSDRDYKLAENVLLQGMNENEGNVDLVFQMGLVMHHSNNLEQALKCYDFVLSQSPEHKDALSMSATALHAIGGRAIDAFNRYNRAIKYNPNNAILLSNFGLLLHSSFRDQVNSNDIVALAEKALSIDSNIPEAIKLINIYKNA